MCGIDKELDINNQNSKKVEIELNYYPVKLLELISSLIRWPVAVLIQEIIANEIRYIKQCINEGSYQFLEEYLDRSDLRVEIKKLLAVI